MAGRWSERPGEERFRAKVLGPRQAAPGPGPRSTRRSGGWKPRASYKEGAGRA